MGVTTNLATTGRNFQYVPSLKAKADEIEALENLDPAIKNRIFPIFHVMSTVSTRFARDLQTAWTGLPIGLDGTFRSTADGSAIAFTALFQAIGNLGAPVLPVIDVGATGPYAAGVWPLANVYAPGLVLRTTLNNLPHAASWIGQIGFAPANVDLVIDAGHVADIDPALLA